MVRLQLLASNNDLKKISELKSTIKNDEKKINESMPDNIREMFKLVKDHKLTVNNMVVVCTCEEDCEDEEAEQIISKINKTVA